MATRGSSTPRSRRRRTDETRVDALDDGGADDAVDGDAAEDADLDEDDAVADDDAVDEDGAATEEDAAGDETDDEAESPVEAAAGRRSRTLRRGRRDRGSAAAGVEARKPWAVRLYLGEIGFDFIGKRKIWYAFSTLLILIALGSMVFKGFNLGVEFAGGERFRSPGSAEQLAEVNDAVEATGVDVISAQAVGSDQLVIITADLTEDEAAAVGQVIADSAGVATADVANSSTSASWGQDVTNKAIQGLLVFLVLVVIFLAIRFQWKMAIAALVALLHDLLITAGVYSLLGFEVTPSAVIGLLTILGFSLYDTVVIFDKIDENARGLLTTTRRTYSESANLAVNQVLMRSINTSVFALLPVLGLLYAGVFLIGEGTLVDLALVLFVGMLAGVYSSIYLAAPVLCDLKEREPHYQQLAKRVASRRAGLRKSDRRDARRSAKLERRGRTAGSGAGRRAGAGTAVLDRPEPGVEVDEPLDDDLDDDLDDELDDELDDDLDIDLDIDEDVDDSDGELADDDADDADADGSAADSPVVAAARRSGPRSTSGARLAPRPGAKPVGRSKGSRGRRR